MRGHIEKRTGKNGQVSYRVRVDLGFDPVTGKRRVGSRTYHTKKAAEKGLHEWLTELAHGTAVEPSRLTLGAYLEQWLEGRRPHLRRATYEVYDRLIHQRLQPLWNVPLQQVRPLQVQRLYGSLRKEGLSQRTLALLHQTLHQALDQAVRWNLLPRNPMDGVERPRYEPYRAQVWNAEQVATFLQAARHDTLWPLWLLALTTGLRRGEMLGLRWSDVDLDAGVLRVTRSLTRLVNGAPVFEPPKTAAGWRPVGLPQIVIEELRALRERHQRIRQALPDWNPHDLVFVRATGEPYQPGNVSRMLHRVITAAELPQLRLHDLRHTHATLLLTEAVHPKIVADRLGHSKIGITLDTYSHVLPDHQRAATEAIERLLHPSVPTSHPSSDQRDKNVR